MPRLLLLSLSLLFIAALIAPLSEGQSYKIAHCFSGCPLGGNESNHLIIRPIYALSYNTSTKSADWVSYKVSAQSIGIASSLSRVPVVDNYVEDTLAIADFFEAESLGFTRSQYVPLVDFAATPYWNEVNYLTNTVARTSSLSQGAWYGLDWSVRNLVNRTGSVFVLTGPVFDLNVQAKKLNTTAEHRVPDGFFKVIITEDGNVASFLMSQDSPVHLHHCEMLSSIEEIESLTNLELFPLMTQTIVESASADLGCA